MTDVAPITRRRRMYLSPRFEILPSRSLSPEEFCRGTRPSQAAKCRPDRNWEESPILATMADAVIGPMPGMVASRWLCSLFLCRHDLKFEFSDSQIQLPELF